jgi:hypothetical protein
MSDDNADRIAELERENAALRSEIERMRPPPRVLKVDGPFMAPDIEQTEKLVRRVLAKYPVLRPDDDPYRGGIQSDEFVKMVRASLLFAGSLYRTRGAVNRQKSGLDWLYSAADYLNSVGNRCGDEFLAVIRPMQRRYVDLSALAIEVGEEVMARHTVAKPYDVVRLSAVARPATRRKAG